MKKLGLVLGVICLVGFFGVSTHASEKVIEQHRGRGQQPWGSKFPVKMMIKDAADVGTTQIVFYEQQGGRFLHPTKVKYAITHGCMRKRDFLKELLTEAEKYDIKVRLAFTPDDRHFPMSLQEKHKDLYPKDSKGNVIMSKYPSTGYYDLNSPIVKQYYKNIIDEINQNYSQYKSLVGIWWHEVDCAEASDTHGDDLEDFKRFCRERFNEEYKGASMPEANAGDKWWRRFYLYRNNVVNTFIKEMAEHARKYNLTTDFCLYASEKNSGESWKWGYDVIGLEKICDGMWIHGFSGENSKPYQSIKGMLVDFGLTYRGQNLSRNYSYAFHGFPLSFACNLDQAIYIKDYRAYYLANKRFTKKFGDFYTGYIGYSEKVLSLFYGRENMKNWLDLMSSWQPGESPAKIAVAVNPIPFVMQYPLAPGNEYKKKVSGMMESLTHHLDLDGMITGSLNMKENLKKYKLIIIPSDNAMGLDEKSFSLYLSYVKNGGKLLIINTPISVGREDLTNLKDKTEKLCGITIKGKNLAGYLSMKSSLASLSLLKKKIWGASSKIESGKAEVLVKNKYTDTPLLTKYSLGKGEVFFSAIGFNPEIVSYFASIVKSAVSSTVSLENSKGMRILETTKKDNSLCISLWGKGNATLKVDTNSIGLKGKNFQVKDIVTGRVINNNISAKSLSTGIPVEIKYLNQPYILALGTKKEIKEYQGIYKTKSEEIFKGMTEVRVIENPEVPILVPSGKGIKVGVYHGGIGTQSIIKALKKEGMRVFSLPRIEIGALSYADVVIIPQCYSRKIFSQSVEDIKKYVKEGGGILLTHDAVGYRKSETIFPEIGKGITNPKLDVLKIVKQHRITADFQKGETFTPGFRYDHISIEKGSSGEVLIENENGAAVVVAGKVGKGKVVLNGMCTGRAGGKRDGSGKEKEPEGGELKVLINAVKWLGSK